MKMKRILYLGYYLKQLDREKFHRFLDHTSRVTGMSKAAIYSDVLKSVFTYNISILEYFQFRFFDLTEDERKTWAGTGFMYEYQRTMNPLEVRSVLENKPEFMEEYAEFIHHSYATVDQLKSEDNVAEQLINTKSGKLVLKRSDGGSGKGIVVIGTSGLTKKKLLEELSVSGNDMVEEFVIQHPDLMKLAPAGLNTIRIITQVADNREVAIIGCRLRMTVKSHVDNMAAGNIAASVDPFTGIVTTNAVYSDMTKDPVDVHPVTGVKIKGFQLPFWKETIDMIQKAALKNISNRSIGWDIAITENGPELIEGNHDWCKLLWQLPEGKGLKHLID
jgi:hypothetical protein